MSLDWADGTEFIGTRNDPALTPIAELTDKEKKSGDHLADPFYGSRLVLRVP